MKLLSKAAVLLLFGFSSMAIADDTARCKQLVEVSITKGIPYTHKEYLTLRQERETYGHTRYFDSEKHQTRFFHSAFGPANTDGKMPLVPPQASAVVIFIHGSGTVKSSGKNFVHNMNSLAKLNIAGVSFDLPFHANGPFSTEFENANYFMEWLRRIVQEVKSYGKPVYFMGHSFGPDVIFEYLSRYPHDVQGALAASPAAFNPVLLDWYNRYTSRMKFPGDVSPALYGGNWAYRVSQQFGWNRGRYADPTLLNPNLRLRILSGNMEEYVPAPLGGYNKPPVGPNTYDISIPLRQSFQNSNIRIQEGVGHYLFSAKDPQSGLDLIYSELIALLSLSPSEAAALEQEIFAQTVAEPILSKVGRLYALDPIFKTWIDNVYGRLALLKALRRQDALLADKMLKEYNLAVHEYDMLITHAIRATQETHPEFYKKYEKYINSVQKDAQLRTIFFPYLELIK